MEVCIDNLISGINAEKGGAVRIELCSSLIEGGLTPSVGFMKILKEKISIPIFPMIRCRGGGFVYSEDEIRIMIEDVKSLKSNGADGFVFGALNLEGKVDVENCKRILSTAGQLPVTFHRAFDEVSDPWNALAIISELGFKRILTSGLKKTALEGLDLLEKLSTDGRILIMPGSGVNSSNILEILKRTKAKEFHGSAKTTSHSNGQAIAITDENEVRKMTEIFKNNQSQSM